MQEKKYVLNKKPTNKINTNVFRIVLWLLLGILTLLFIALVQWYYIGI